MGTCMSWPPLGLPEALLELRCGMSRCMRGTMSEVDSFQALMLVLL